MKDWKELFLLKDLFDEFNPFKKHSIMIIGHLNGIKITGFCSSYWWTEQDVKFFDFAKLKKEQVPDPKRNRISHLKSRANKVHVPQKTSLEQSLATNCYWGLYHWPFAS